MREIPKDVKEFLKAKKDYVDLFKKQQEIILKIVKEHSIKNDQKLAQGVRRLILNSIR